MTASKVTRRGKGEGWPGRRPGKRYSHDARRGESSLRQINPVQDDPRDVGQERGAIGCRGTADIQHFPAAGQGGRRSATRRRIFSYSTA